MTESYVGNNAVLKYFETHYRKTPIRLRSSGFAEVFGALSLRFVCPSDDYDALLDNKRQQMKSFFQDIILEREKRNAGKNYIIEGVKVLNEARFSNSDEIVSIINKRHLQIEKVNNEPPRTPEHQIYQSQKNQRRTRTGKKVDDSYELASNLSEDDYNKDNEENKKEKMWRLSTGKYVEEELFELGKKLRFEHAVHSFILDVDDGIIRLHFSKAELDEIDCAPGPQVPKLSEEITGFLNKFAGKTSLKEIRKLIKEMMFDDNYDHEKDRDKDYIIYALYSLVREIQSGSLKDANLEAWFNCHVWNAVFDQAFGDVNAISVVRGESTSLASASRKNIKRLSGERRKMGCRIDWILRSISNGDRDEFGAGEAGKSWVDKNVTKFLKETGLKLPKTLKDMLVKLIEKAVWDEESRAKIQTVGIIHAGYICRVQRGEIMEVPDKTENFPCILTILASVLIIKAVVQEIIKTVQAKKQTVKSFKRAGFRKRSLDKNEDRISPCLSTPKKAKVCAEAYTEKSYPSSPCPESSSQRSDLFSYLE
ncbi:2103_t:CDS:10 [Entrophospora sp. SA101]|nr:2103_t:CDS:10 [Entrophospora sp. SA101]